MSDVLGVCPHVRILDGFHHFSQTNEWVCACWHDFIYKCVIAFGWILYIGCMSGKKKFNGFSKIGNTH